MQQLLLEGGLLLLALLFVLLNVGLAWAVAWAAILQKVPGVAPDLLRLTSNYLLGRPNKRRRPDGTALASKKQPAAAAAAAAAAGLKSRR